MTSLMKSILLVRDPEKEAVAELGLFLLLFFHVLNVGGRHHHRRRRRHHRRRRDRGVFRRIGRERRRVLGGLCHRQRRPSRLLRRDECSLRNEKWKIKNKSKNTR